MQTRLSGTRLIFVLAGLVALAGVAACLAAGLLLVVVRREELSLVSQPEEPLVSTGGQLAFISDRDGPRELYLMDADGSHPTRLTYTDGDIWSAAWSPDGRYLAFVQGRVEQADVYVLDVEAALAGPVAPLRLTNQTGFDGYPAWSPDEAWLVFSSDARAPAGAYLVDAADFLAAPAWSEPRLAQPWAGYRSVWSPDGTYLAFESHMGGVRLMRAEDLLAATQAGGMHETYLAAGREPSWSPDGRQLVFERDGDLYRVNLDGSSPQRLTDTPRDESGPAWSPDGQEIAFISRASGSSDMGQPYLMNADGSGQRQLCSIAAAELAWSPDSTRLAFYSNRGRGPGTNGEIWVMNRDGSGLTVLTDHPAWDGWPIWRPSSRSPALEHVLAARATLEAVRTSAQRGVSRNANWTPFIREFGGMPMALVPAGCFTLGRDAEELHAALERCRPGLTEEPGQAEPGCEPPADLENQTPAHQVCFDEPFWIGLNEVTVAQFRAWGELGECLNDREGDQHPCQETWTGADAFCKQYGLRLPSEAEWEYAARGPDGLLFPWGNDFVSDNLVWGTTQAADVGSKPGGVSWVGALDMLGNAWEWTNTGYAPYPYRAADGREEEDNPSYNTRVLRGHGWDDTSRPLWEAGVWSAATRSSDWMASPPRPSYGFRCARSYQ